MRLCCSSAFFTKINLVFLGYPAVLQYFWNLPRNAGDPYYVFTGVEMAAYRPLLEFTAVLPGLQGRALQRARELAK